MFGCWCCAGGVSVRLFLGCCEGYKAGSAVVLVLSMLVWQLDAHLAQLGGWQNLQKPQKPQQQQQLPPPQQQQQQQQ